MADAWQSAWVEVVPDFQKFRGQANREMGGILGSAGDDAGRKGSTAFGGSFVGGIGKLAVPIAGAFAALGIGQMIGDAVSAGVSYAMDSIDLASDLAETKSAIDEVFGAESAAALGTWASTAATGLGQTSQQALNAAKTFGVFGQAAGLNGPELVNFSTGLTSLATDLASFHNTDVDTAIQAIGAGLRGEAEPLRQFGILMDDASLKAKALELGVYSGTGALTAQQRTLAAQALIMASAGAAAGDFERTSGGLANQQRILAASFTEAQTKLGTALLPAMTSLATLANEQLVPVLNTVVDQVGPVLAGALAQSAPAFADLMEQVAPLVPQLVRLGSEALPPLIDLVIAISPLLIDWAANTASTLAVMRSMAGFLNGDKSIAGLQRTLGGLTGSFSEALRGALNFASGVRNSIASAAATAASFTGQFFSAGRNLIQGFINGAMSLTRNMVNRITAPFRGLVSSVKGVLGIRSPSRVFAEMGKMSALGYTGGLDRQMARSDIGDIFAARVVAPAVRVNASTIGPAAVAGGGGGFTWNGNINTTQPADQAVVSRLREVQYLAGF